jgi:predicted nucleic acid-binding protein
LLDSSVIIAALNPKDKHHESAMNLDYEGYRILASSLSISEVMPQAISSNVANRVKSALEALINHFVDVDRDIAYRAAELRATTNLKTPDAIIAATAQIHKAELWTFDAKLAKVTPGARCLA